MILCWKRRLLIVNVSMWAMFGVLGKKRGKEWRGSIYKGIWGLQEQDIELWMLERLELWRLNNKTRTFLVRTCAIMVLNNLVSGKQIRIYYGAWNNFLLCLSTWESDAYRKRWRVKWIWTLVPVLLVITIRMLKESEFNVPQYDLPVRTGIWRTIWYMSCFIWIADVEYLWCSIDVMKHDIRYWNL